MFKMICEKLDLGNYIESSNVAGGITNKMYKVITDKDIYAIKVINENRSDDLVSLLEEIENSEKIANIAYENGINAVCALKFNDNYIQKIDNKYIIIYKWLDGVIKLTREITLDDVSKVAKEQAKLHSINTDNYQTNKKIYRQAFNDFKKFYELLKDNNEDYILPFKNNIDIILEMYQNIYNNYLKLDDKLVFAHRDLNRKNVMWSNNEPYIIDWETTRISEPSIDFFNSIWFLSNDVEEEKFIRYASSYLEMKKINIENGVYAGIIEECNWLYFSLERLFSDDEEERFLGKESIESSITEITNYYNKIPLMKKLLKRVK